MADNTVLSTGAGGDTIATDDIAGVKHQLVKVEFGAADSATQVSAAAPLPTVQTGALPAGANAIGKLAANSGVDIGDVDVTSVPGTAADGAAGLPSVTYVVAGYDGTNVQALVTDSTGRLILPPTSQAGATVKTSDYDTGAGTDTVAMQGIALPASGGSVQGGTSTNPVRTDPTGTTAQPITDNGGSITVDDGAGSLTVDAPVGTPAFVRLSDGAAAITALPVTDNAGSLTVDNAGTFAVQIAANSSVNQAQIAGTATSVNSGNKDAGTQRVVIATDQVQLTNALKVDGSAVTQPVSGNVGVLPITAGGLSISHLVSAATTNATNVKASAGQLYGWYIYNSNAAARKVAFHNTAGTPTAGASVVFAIVIPPTSAANVEFTTGIAFATGIAFTTVTDLTDAGSTAVAANDLIINLFYK